MFIDDTITAISTPVGQGGIGIVRLSGKNAIKIADTIFRSPKKKKLVQSPSHRILYGHIVDPSDKTIVDEVLVSVMRSPHTYTKENIVEINCHGGAMPLRAVLELTLSKGARLAEPGEFTKRAFLNGRIDLAQAEAVLDVINSLTAESRKSAVSQLRGSLSKKIDSLRNNLIELAAFVEAHIDFPEEDIGPVSIQKMQKMALTVQKSLNRLIESSRYGIILREGIKTAIVGRPNVGKSSLLNALIESDRAIVTEFPGTTRDVIEEHLNIQGFPVRVMDTAGIRSVEDIAEKEGVRRSMQTMKNADLVLLMLDGSHPLHDTDIDLVKKSDPSNTIIVINKQDLPHKIIPSGVPQLKAFRGRTLKISAKRKTGLKRLKDLIIATVLRGQTVSGSETVTNVRHVHALERVRSSLNAFLAGMKENTPPEFLSVELRDAFDAIGEIQGITTPDDILNRIFSSFCIGK
jgi:tRNA modification GTPase